MKRLHYYVLILVLFTQYSCSPDKTYTKEKVIGEWKCTSFESSISDFTYVEEMRTYNMGLTYSFTEEGNALVKYDGKLQFVVDWDFDPTTDEIIFNKDGAKFTSIGNDQFKSTSKLKNESTEIIIEKIIE